MKDNNNTKKLSELFGDLPDPRRNLGQLHDLNDILVIGIISVICGAETWNNMQEYAEAKEDFLRQILDLPNGIPSHDTFNRVFSSIDSTEFEARFIKWVTSLVQDAVGQVISIDGKTVRGAKSQGNKSPIHIVSAWAEESNLVLGQVKTNEKSNEITAIPQLLELISIKECVVTIDAMGCQHKIASKIREKEADYILGVKGNQESLLEDVEHQFKVSNNLQTNKTIDGDHGRIETRVCTITTEIEEIEKQENWTGLSTLIKIESKREFKNSDKPTEIATRYYISSKIADAAYFQTAIRSHWGIENKLHWSLDVAFGEDASRKRTKNAAQNFSLLNKIALNLLRNEKTLKMGIKGRRLKAGWDNAYLIKVLKLL